jgi:hypothetical protein
MSKDLWPELYPTLLAYVLRSALPRDTLRFRRLVGARGELGGVTAACFLLYRPPDGRSPCVHDWIFYSAPLLLPQLTRTTERQQIALHGRIRGRVDWSSTYKARYTEDGNPTVFVCRQSRRRFDRPENQLVKYLLHAVQVCLERVPSSWRGWQAWGPTPPEGEDSPLEIGGYFGVLAHRAATYGAHVHLREVELPARVSERHLLAARTSKNALYADVAGLYALYRAVVEAPEPGTWADVLGQTLPLPPAAGAVGRAVSRASAAGRREGY